MILSSIVFAIIGQNVVLHKFEFISPKPAKTVTLAGTFNGWNKSANPMKIGDDGRTWSTSLQLPFGRHQYKFVIDDSEWVTDPKVKAEDDGGGNMNSILLISPPDFGIPASPDDNEIAKSAIRHRESAPDINFDAGKLALRLQTRTNDVSMVELVANGKSYPAKLKFSDDMYATYEAHTPWNKKSDVKYNFIVRSGKASTSTATYNLKASKFKPFAVPNWVQGGVIYQIFPDRFANADKSNDPADVVAWNGKPTYSNRMGGDAAGIKLRAMYLKELGIQSIYYNPIFVAPSNHRYDATDFLKVDKEIGTNKEFNDLTAHLHKMGIRTILDFAFNHTATDSEFFKDLIANGADSKYKNWYFPKSFPIKVQENPNYEAWYGFPSMPKLNVLNPETKQYLLDVCSYWAKTGKIDGMRLDVANEVDQNFWRTMRPFVKGINPDMWIVGEIWGDGSPWLGGDQFDSVMNYQFRGATISCIAKSQMPISTYAARLMAVHNSYAPQVSRNMMNLLGSHDTPRFLNECNFDADLARLAATIQFTWIGAPSVYYGDELGMFGGADPENRKGMEWEKATPSNPFLKHYKKLCALRTKTQAFGDGDVEFILTDDNKQVGVFSRNGAKDSAIVAFNRSNQEQTVSINIPKSVLLHNSKAIIDALSGKQYANPNHDIQITLKPKSAQVLIAASKSNSSPVAIQTAPSLTQKGIRINAERITVTGDSTKQP
jgi:cyclomaltodextrinase / maltogenic alpha-amylase / neopullulanase